MFSIFYLHIFVTCNLFIFEPFILGFILFEQDAFKRQVIFNTQYFPYFLKLIPPCTKTMIIPVNE